MIGLEYILNLFSFQHVELAEKLNIKKQNINMWVKGRQDIPKKYLLVLEELFGIDQSYFGRELTEIDKLEIQKEKLKRELKSLVKRQERQFFGREINRLIEVPFYNKEEMYAIERDIEKAKLVSRFRAAMDNVDNNPHLETCKLIVELLEKVQHKSVLQKTIESLANDYDVLFDWVSSEQEQEGFEGEVFEVFDNHKH